MRNFSFDAHRSEMNRMQRQVRRQVAVIQIVCALMFIAVVGGAAWLLFHPEAVGGFLGRIVAGFGSAQHHG